MSVCLSVGMSVCLITLIKRTSGKYEKIPKNHLAMDPYKLEYFTLNPGVTLGDGHFGIVRRGQCSVLPDRRGEMTDIAIKEVKPCIDKSRREEDLKRERDIMMRVSYPA